MKTAVVFGGGAVGTWISAILEASGYLVTIVDRRPRTLSLVGEVVAGDLAAPSGVVLRLLAVADIVVMAVPETPTLAGIGAVADTTSSATLLVETLSVKSRFAAAFGALGARQPVVGINPLFRPSPSQRGGVVVLVDHAGRGDDGFGRMLADAGCGVHALDAIAHDRSMAVIQCLTHAAILSFGVAFRSLRLSVPRLDGLATPPFAALSALLARILTGEPHVYWDIQGDNPFAAEARRALRAGVSAIDRLAREGDAEGFTALIAKLGSDGPVDRELGAERCEAMLGALTARNPAGTQEQRD